MIFDVNSASAHKDKLIIWLTSVFENLMVSSPTPAA